MAGLENGSSQANAFSWDVTQYPGGTRVFGATTYNQSEEWWAVYLKAGQTYTFQTRLPTNYYHYLYLYDSNGSYLSGNSYGGDDGGYTTKITYTPQREGWYTLAVYGYYYYNEYGPYVLESVPAPKSFRTFVIAPGRCDWRATNAIEQISQFNILRDRTATQSNSRYTINARVTAAGMARFAPHSGRKTEIVSRFGTTKAATVAVVPSQFSFRQPCDSQVAARFDTRAVTFGHETAQFDWRHITGLDVTSRFDMRCITHNVAPSRHHAFLREGWTIYACNTQNNQRTCLGFIPAEDQLRQLTDMPLADGVYEIEIVASHAFWDSARSRQRLTLITGETVPLLGLPAIQNLRRELTHFATVIRWSVAADAIADDLQFGVWFGVSSPVDTARDPDQLIPLFPGVGNYQTTRFQTVSEHIAVAVLGPSDRGPVAELPLPWESTPPDSPREQLALP
ncbi:MAG: PPC domain-containing protein [Phycisphaerales bacterium]|nr:PPC domain-containing protein [Phycisphaerales bacterium]